MSRRQGHWGGRGGPRSRPGAGPGRRDWSSVDRIRAPYNFVPVSEHVVLPEWGQQVRQDIPFRDGIGGTLTVDVLPQGPFFVRGTDRPEQPYRLPDGRLAIPGSSLRGMLRNVVEIASFGRMRRVADARYGFRDLQNDALYRRHMAEIVKDRRTGKGVPVPLVSAGWLMRHADVEDGEAPAYIVPCSMAKIEYELLEELAKKGGARGFQAGRRRRAPERYRAWGRAPLGASLAVQEIPRRGLPGNPKMVGSYGKVVSLSGNTRGLVVLTGQPNEWRRGAAPKRRGAGNPKHHDFFFHDPQHFKPIEISRQVFEDFLFVHSDAGEQHRMTDSANEELRDWLRRVGWEPCKGERPSQADERWRDKEGWTAREWGSLEAHPGIPVFFLLDPDGDVRAIGLAGMFRLAYDMRVRDALPEAHRAQDGPFDLAELLFGEVPLGRRDDTDAAHRGLKGRVSVGTAVPAGKGQFAVREEPVKLALGAPKPTFYPAYLEQPDPRRGYKTFMDGDARLRGWKRYQQMTGHPEQKLPKNARGEVLERVVTTMHPVEAREGARLQLRIRVHNLRPIELGALLWALDFGGHPDARHGLGLAKPFGYGAVKLEVSSHRLRRVRDQGLLDDDGLASCRGAYADYMEGELSGKEEGGWAGSRPLFQLLCLARPSEELEGLRHMDLYHPQHRNEFSGAKKAHLRLEPAGSEARWRPFRDAARARRRKDGRPGPVPVQPAAPEDPDAQEEAELRRALKHGTHWALIGTWMKEGRERVEARRRIANKVISKPSSKARLKRATEIAWMRGE